VIILPYYVENVGCVVDEHKETQNQIDHYQGKGGIVVAASHEK
jgi:hypothetical protein